MKFARLTHLVRRLLTPQSLRLTWLLTVPPLLTATAAAYLVGPPMELEKLAETADVIFKGTVVADTPVKDPSFTAINDFGVHETQFKVVSVIKGSETTSKFRFRHYDENPTPAGRMFEPQFYHLDAGHTYLVFAKHTDTPGLLRQVWMNHTGKEDQGLFRCADSRVEAPGTIKEIVWAEMQCLLRSPVPKDVLYGLRQLNQMSGVPGDFGATKDFDRTEVLKAVAPLLASESPEISQAVIKVVGSGNPYMSDDLAPYWLATVGSGDIPGLGHMDAKAANTGGGLLEKDLVAVVDTPGLAATRALAVRALGRVGRASLAEPLGRWLHDPEAAVRAAAILLQADFPGGDAAKSVAALSGDTAPEVRRCAAHAIGFLQLADLAGKLGTLLQDADARVRLAASQSLLSLSPRNPGVEKVLTENLHQEEFQPLFLNALAREQPAKYLDALATTVESRTTPKNWQGGQVPSFTAFNILFKYLQAQPAEDVRSGKFNRYLDALEKGYVTGSSEPRDIYAFYLQRDMRERAQQYREVAKKGASFDLDYFFNQVDHSPATYTR